MTKQDRKEKAFLHKALIDILTDCPNDMAYLKRLIFAQEIITNAIEEFTDKEYMDIIMELQRSQRNLTTRPAHQLELFNQKNFFTKLLTNLF